MQKAQFSKGIFWRSFVERKIKETFVLLNNEVTEAWYLPLVLLFIYLRCSPTVALLAQANKALNWPDASLFCRDTSSIRGRSIFFSSLFLYFFQKSKHLFKKKNCAVEAAKSDCLSLCHVKIYLGRIHSKRCCSEN